MCDINNIFNCTHNSGMIGFIKRMKVWSTPIGVSFLNLYPFVLFRRENVTRRVVECRGIPEIVKTWQGEIKAQRDSIYDSTSFETLPPLQVSKRLGLANKIGPGVQLPVTKPGDYAWSHYSDQ